MKIKIFSLGEKGFAVVEALSTMNFKNSITCVIGQDNAVEDDWSLKLAEFCDRNGIQYIFRNMPNEDDCDLYMAVGWRWLIKDIPKEKLIIFHDSLLPKYRGFSPLISALLNKEKLAGVTVFLASDEYDKGNVLMQKSINLNYPTYIEKEIKRISVVCANLAVEIIEKFYNRTINKSGYPQDENKATYSLWRNDDDYRINWSNSADDILHFINCLGWPYRGASALLNGNLVRVFKANCQPDVMIENRSVGKVIFVEEGLPVVVCGKGLLMLEDVRDNVGRGLLPLENFRSKFS